MLGEAYDKDESEDFEELADDLGKKCKGGDGLEYQIRIREEWDHRP